MAKVVVNDTSLFSIGEAIREKNGTNVSYKPSEMGAAISALKTKTDNFNLTDYEVYENEQVLNTWIWSDAIDMDRVELMIISWGDRAMVYIKGVVPEHEDVDCYNYISFQSETGGVDRATGNYIEHSPSTTATAQKFRESRIEMVKGNPIKVYRAGTTSPQTPNKYAIYVLMRKE